MTLSGTSLIGFQRGATHGTPTEAVNPATGEPLAPANFAASAEEVDRAAALASAAFPSFSRTTGKQRAQFLRTIAGNIEALGDALTQRAMAETGLAEARVKGETGRTCFQLRMFAALVEEGSWCEARIDHGDPGRQPLPKPDLRSLLRPVGPTAVFCASNFPLAYSVAGGDTASAFAAGCPVIVKAHSSHPGTAELVGLAVSAAVRDCGLHEGAFSLLFGPGRAVGQALVAHPSVKAVGFTGSRAGGRALMDLAAQRPEPIPVYAEMSSINPVFLLPDALAQHGSQIAAGLHASVTNGVGQFCTNPGLIVALRGPALDAFTTELANLISGTPPAVMLNRSICRAFHQGTDRLAEHPQVQTQARAGNGAAGTGSAALFTTTAEAFLEDPRLAEEVFGPATLLVIAEKPEDFLRIAAALEGQLTATLHGSPAEMARHTDLLATLERKAGRLLAGGFPTGVEVCPSMVHGGPYPATADGRSTAVGTQAIFRFTRAVCFQNFPDALLPPELQETNPLGIWRLVDGDRTRQAGL
ncbi:MAG: aldehyde dehydrogenase (NADP(+)) [Verrucomicrobiales bacterium]|nr:aldehyde dehydrogenase (NADP(+)) [Verrucomicrobiales bacterium]